MNITPEHVEAARQFIRSAESVEDHLVAGVLLAALGVDAPTKQPPGRSGTELTAADLGDELEIATHEGKLTIGEPIRYGQLRRKLGALRGLTAREARPLFDALEAAGRVQIVEPVERGGRYRYGVVILPSI